jgi:hypothetical protein
MKGLRFRKRIKLFSLAHLNVSKSGASLSLGIPGLTHNVNLQGKQQTTFGLPGSGMSYTRHHKKEGE